MNTLITICARGGSKGLPNKHLLEFNGKPLILWTVEQAVEWDQADIALSSDSSDIRNLVTREYFIQNATKRPNELSGDDVPKLDVIRHTLIDTEERLSKQYDVVVDLDATNPLRTSDDITGCYRKLTIMPDCPVVFTVVRGRRNPYFNMIEPKQGWTKLCKQLEMDPVFTRQKAPPVFELNCCIYAYRRNWILHKKHKSPIVPHAGFWIMPAWTFCDIDSQVDFEVAEFLMRKYML